MSFVLTCVYFARSQSPPQNGQQQGQPSNKRLQQTQAQVDEVVGIMRTNVEKVLERDQKLSELDNRAGMIVYLTFS